MTTKKIQETDPINKHVVLRQETYWKDSLCIIFFLIYLFYFFAQSPHEFELHNHMTTLAQGRWCVRQEP